MKVQFLKYNPKHQLYDLIGRMHNSANDPQHEQTKESADLVDNTALFYLCLFCFLLLFFPRGLVK